MSKHKAGYILANPFFGDLWLVSFTEPNTIVLLGDGYTEELDAVIGFEKVGHIYKRKYEKCVFKKNKSGGLAK